MDIFCSEKGDTAWGGKNDNKKKKEDKSKMANKKREGHQRGECKKKTKLDWKQEKHNTQDVDKETLISNSKLTKLWGPAILWDKEN